MEQISVIPVLKKIPPLSLITVAGSYGFTCLKLSFGAGSLVTTIYEAHDPPLKGMENDRVPRQESYEKNFKAHRAGVIKLKKGTGEMTLEALTMPGSGIIDFRLLMLTRIN